MKRFSRLPSIEMLEEKRLKAADLACSIAHGPGFVEAADAAPICVPTSSALHASQLEQSKSLASSATAEDTEDESSSEVQGSETDGSDNSESNDSGDSESDDSDDNESDDTGENEIDDSDDSEGDNTDDNETDGSADNETDNSDDNESDDSDGDDSDDADDNDSDDNDSSDQEMDFSATLTGTGEGTASVETESEDASTKTDFKIKVTGAPANQTFQVTVDSTVVGSLTTDAEGAGKLKLASDPDDDEQALPADFPTVSDGTTVSVGLAGQPPILTGSFTMDSEASDSEQLQSSSLSSGQLSLPSDFQTGASGAATNSAALQFSASSLAPRQSTDDSALDPNLVDLVYATADDPHVSEEQSALLENDTTDRGDDSADSVFESLSSNPLTWTN